MTTKIQKEKKEFIPNMTVKQALDTHEEVGLVLASYHLGGCSHCGINEVETLEEVCAGYGVPLEALLGSLNSLLEE